MMKDKIDINLHTIAKNLKDFRRKNNLTQTALANDINTTHSVISSYENAKILIQTTFLFDICKKYNLSILTMFASSLLKLFLIISFAIL